MFSQGHIILSHLQSQLSAQSTQALICLGVWGHLEYMKNSDLKEVIVLPEVPAGEKEGVLITGWDSIVL